MSLSPALMMSWSPQAYPGGALLTGSADWALRWRPGQAPLNMTKQAAAVTRVLNLHIA